MTHDLLQNVLDDLGVSLEKVTITELRDGVFHAELELHAHDGIHTLSSRPSDAIALAARTGSPIYAAEAVLDEAGYLEDDPRTPTRTRCRAKRWSSSSGTSSTR